MVHLHRLYTRTGDGGQTGLGDGTRVTKADLRVEAGGAVDELNAALGVVLSCQVAEEIAGVLRAVQHDLFDLGADLSQPQTGNATPGEALRLAPGLAQALEEWIDTWNARLELRRSFILPAGTPAAAQMHLARTVCRRAERRVVALRDSGFHVNEAILVYLNRLSDLLFVGARMANLQAGGDVLWVPGSRGKGGRPCRGGGGA